MKKKFHRPVIALAICVAWTLLVLALYSSCFDYPQLLKGEFWTQDLRSDWGRKTPLDSQLVLVGIDQPSYQQLFSDEQRQASTAARLLSQNYPWSREVWALLIDKLAQAGAKVIAIDLVFAAPGPGDEALRGALEKYGDRVVIGCNLTMQTTDRGGTGNLLWPTATVLPETNQTVDFNDGRVGYVNIFPDPDEVSRRAVYRMSYDQTGGLIPAGQSMESFAARILRKAGRADTIPDGFHNTLFRFTHSTKQYYAQHSLAGLFDPKIWKQNYANGEFFRDKIVVVGPTANIFHDVLETPVGVIPGPEYHLNIVAATLRGELMRESTLWLDFLTATIAGLAAWLLALLINQPLRRAGIGTALVVGFIILCQILFDRTNFVLFASSPLLAFGSSSLSVFIYDFVLERREKRRVRRTLERYVSKDVVRELLDNPQTFFNAMGGVRKPVTVLFSDVRGFTTLTESADSHTLVKQLNEYFEEMVRHVFGHQGSLDKFIGDAVMAVWGNIVSHGPAVDAGNAIATALAMKQSLRKLNDDWKARGMPELAVGIGINCGEVIVGNLGSSEKMELTVIGDPVNLASRLEGLTKEYHLDLLLGEKLAPLVGDHYILRLVDCVQVKGKTKPVDVFTVIGDGASQTVSMPVWLARYEEGVRLYRQREFAAAAKSFQECLRRQPDDFLCGMYLKRCQALIENPPDETWNGVFVMTKK